MRLYCKDEHTCKTTVVDQAGKLTLYIAMKWTLKNKIHVLYLFSVGLFSLSFCSNKETFIISILFIL